MAAVGCDVDRPGEEQRDRPRQQAMLDRLDPLVERRLVVGGEDLDGLLEHDRAAVERLVDEVDGRAGHADARDKRVADRMRARERWQERRVGVEDPATERVEHRRPDDPQVAGEDDGVGRGGGEGLRDGVVGAARDHGRVDPLLRGPVDRRAGPVGEDQHDLRASSPRDAAA